MASFNFFGLSGKNKQTKKKEDPTSFYNISLHTVSQLVQKRLSAMLHDVRCPRDDSLNNCSDGGWGGSLPQHGTGSRMQTAICGHHGSTALIHDTI